MTELSLSVPDLCFTACQVDACTCHKFHAVDNEKCACGHHRCHHFYNDQFMAMVLSTRMKSATTISTPIMNASSSTRAGSPLLHLQVPLQEPSSGSLPSSPTPILTATTSESSSSSLSLSPTPGNGSAFASRSPPPTNVRADLRDITRFADKTFELDVNVFLNNHMQSVLPQCEFSSFKNREVDKGEPTHTEIDCFAYMKKDSLCGVTDNSSLGFYGIRPRAPRLHKSPKKAPARNLGNSPMAKETNLAEIAQKYVITECYSGDNKLTVKIKVKQLETKVVKFLKRHASSSGKEIPAEDCTEVIGAAILAFFCSDGNRKQMAEKYKKIVEETVHDNPNLWRLCRADRLILVVLCRDEAPTTSAIQKIGSVVENLSEDVQNLSLEVEKLWAAQGETNRKLDEILEVLTNIAAQVQTN